MNCLKKSCSVPLTHCSSPLTFSCSESTPETLEKGVKYVQNSEHISHFFLVFLLLTLNK